MRALAAALALCAAAPQALACEGCEALDPTLADAAHVLATVTVPKARFRDDDGALQKSYVVKGDELIVSRADGLRILATYLDSKGRETSNWLEARDVALTAAGPLPVEAFLGRWTAGEHSRIDVSRGARPGWLTAEGTGLWGSSAENIAQGFVNIGEFAGEGPVEGGKFGFTGTDDDSYKPFDATEGTGHCAVELEIVSARYLYVQDNGSCGGHNVRFWGYYARAK
jgi:hypothetical protein